MSVDIVLWEIFRTTNLPVSGAAVNVRVATTSQPNTTGTLVATGNTGANGQFSATGLADNDYDVDVTYAGVTKSYKGLTKFNGIVQASNFQAQSPNTFLASPSGSSGRPTFRGIVDADLPSIIKATAHVLGDGTDTTKQLAFSVSGATTGTQTIFQVAQTANRTIVFPDASDTVALLAAVQSLSNKTLVTPTIASFANAQHTHANAAGGGQLGTTALVANTVTQIGVSNGVAQTTTTSATYTPVEGNGVSSRLRVDLTTGGGDLLCFVRVATAITNTFIASLGLSLDGAAAVDVAQMHCPFANATFQLAGFHRFTGVSAAAHSVEAQISTSGGTLTEVTSLRELLVVEVKR